MKKKSIRALRNLINRIASTVRKHLKKHVVDVKVTMLDWYLAVLFLVAFFILLVVSYYSVT